MRILLATDAWQPQVNGVVRTIERLVDDAAELGAEVEVLGPDRFKTVPLPTYSEIRLALTRPRTIGRMLEAAEPDYIHIATEGPIGLMTRKYCMRTKRPFTTSYHTRFPEYVAARMPVPTQITYRWLRRFHNAGRAIMVTTESLAEELRGRGFTNPVIWPRGVDSELFRPQASILDLPGPIFMYVGRVAVEKNLEAFLSLDLPGTKVIVGDGPQKAELEEKFPDVVFTGTKIGEELAAHYASADVFVFPSRTDTLGLVVLEALAAGVPVAAYPVTGPKDIIGDAPVGILSEDLKGAALKALEISPEACRAHALRFSWRECAAIFLDNVRRYQGDSVEPRSAA